MSKRLTLRDLETKLTEIITEVNTVKEEIKRIKSDNGTEEVLTIKSKLNELDERLSRSEKNIDEIIDYLHKLYEYLKNRNF